MGYKRLHNAYEYCGGAVSLRRYHYMLRNNKRTTSSNTNNLRYGLMTDMGKNMII